MGYTLGIILMIFVIISVIFIGYETKDDSSIEKELDDMEDELDAICNCNNCKTN